ncbi:MAG TPA: AMP-binding protein [Sporichthyaceae bacterium]|jgi:2,3-dihydroxybenzoate-AMP ligase|nr:AMP-binding protein [Sporichthyaceae bacterium]
MATPIAEHLVPWPEDYVARYVAEGYWAGRTLSDLLDEAADLRPAALALVDGAMRLTYRQLMDRAAAAAARLRALGLRRGDRLVVQLGNTTEFVVLTLACLRAGVVPVMTLPAHRHSELSHLAAHAEAVGIAVPDSLSGFDHQGLAHELRDGAAGPWHVLVAGDHLDTKSIDLRAVCAHGPERLAAEDHPDPRDVAVFLLSGGTTGLPKLIARTHDDYAYNARASAAVAGLDAQSRYLVCLPAGHNFPLACPGILGTLLVGGCVVLAASPRPDRVFPLIAAEGVTHTALVPAVAITWLEHAKEQGAGELAPLRVLQVGGSRLSDEHARRIGPALGVVLQQVFGMAEGLLNYTRLDDPPEVVCTTQGRPMAAADEIRLVDEHDVDVPPGAPGSLLTRGPYTPRGYYRAPEQNARAFTAGGWYRSGDICRLTLEGNLIVEGRDKDMINRGGEKISAEEVENLVLESLTVSQVAAVAMPDPVLGERVCLYLVAHPGLAPTLDDIRAALEERKVARFKLPEHLVLVEDLPLTRIGKVDKKALREDIARRRS